MNTATKTLRRADAKRGACILTQDDERGRYVFDGPSGEHSLDIGSTDEARLDAHWDGYVEVNGGEPTDHEWAELGNDRELSDDAFSISWWSYRDNGTPGPETNAHLQIEGASKTLCGRRFPDEANWESGDGQTECRACARVQRAAERRVEAFGA